MRPIRTQKVNLPSSIRHDRYRLEEELFNIGEDSYVCIRGGPDVDFLIFADADIDVDTYFQYLPMRM